MHPKTSNIHTSTSPNGPSWPVKGYLYLFTHIGQYRPNGNQINLIILLGLYSESMGAVWRGLCDVFI